MASEHRLIAYGGLMRFSTLDWTEYRNSRAVSTTADPRGPAVVRMLVEAAGIEPASESPSTTSPTSVVGYLSLARVAPTDGIAARQPG
jgi:hypothetical protein